VIRALRRLILIPRSLRVAREREYQELDRFLADIRKAREDRPPWNRASYADEVD
jgi:hypothetical protein